MVGPLSVPATKYKADKADMMDMAMSWTLCDLDAEKKASLWIRRLAPGKYEIDGRQVTLRWRSARSSDIVVREDHVPVDADPMPLALGDYLRQVASVIKLRQQP